MSKRSMNDSDAHDDLDAKHERDREQRIEAVKRWVDYIRSEPPETWGPQQNAVVDGQLDSARSAGTSAAHRRHVRAVAAEILEGRDDEEDSG